MALRSLKDISPVDLRKRISTTTDIINNTPVDKEINIRNNILDDYGIIWKDSEGKLLKSDLEKTNLEESLIYLEDHRSIWKWKSCIIRWCEELSVLNKKVNIENDFIELFSFKDTFEKYCYQFSFHAWTHHTYVKIKEIIEYNIRKKSESLIKSMIRHFLEINTLEFNTEIIHKVLLLCKQKNFKGFIKIIIRWLNEDNNDLNEIINCVQRWQQMKHKRKVLKLTCNFKTIKFYAFKDKILKIGFSNRERKKLKRLELEENIIVFNNDTSWLIISPEDSAAITYWAPNKLIKDISTNNLLERQIYLFKEKNTKYSKDWFHLVIVDDEDNYYLVDRGGKNCTFEIKDDIFEKWGIKLFNDLKLKKKLIFK